MFTQRSAWELVNFGNLEDMLEPSGRIPLLATEDPNFIMASHPKAGRFVFPCRGAPPMQLNVVGVQWTALQRV